MNGYNNGYKKCNFNDTQITVRKEILIIIKHLHIILY